LCDCLTWGGTPRGVAGVKYFEFKIYFSRGKLLKATGKYGKRLNLALSTWVKLARASALFGKRTGDHIRCTGLTVAQFSAMETLYHRGPLTPGELCSKQLVSGGNMTVVLDNLEKEGLITRVRSLRDRRSTTVHLTDQGKERMERFFPEHARVVAELLSVLSADELRRLGDLLRKLGFSLQGKELPAVENQEAGEPLEGLTKHSETAQLREDGMVLIKEKHGRHA
jgi:MarR family 2-MHQ and catechol resistance regulon transcriptional repressor